MADTGGAAGHASPVKSATRTLDIIEFVVAHDRPLVAQEIASALGIPVSSLSYLLATLVEREYLSRDGRRYSAGPGLERLQVKGRGLLLAERVAPLVRSIRIQLNETASFFIRNGWEVEPIVTETSEQALRYSVTTGRRMPMHSMASGKALLAALPEDELDRYFAESTREKISVTTITSERALRKQIEDIRRTGFAVTDEEYSLGIHSIGHAVSMNGEVVGSLSVAIPKVRLTEALEQQAYEILARTSSLLEAR